LEVSELWRNGKARSLKVGLNAKSFVTPTYFPSLSSTETTYSFRDLLHLLVDHRYPRLLLSAYDLSRLGQMEWSDTLTSFATSGILFLDSGVFESTHLSDLKWAFEDYKAIVKRIKCDLYATFDLSRTGSGSSDYWPLMVDSIRLSTEIKHAICVPIFHKPKGENVVSEVSKGLRDHPDSCQAIAITEKDCGQDLLERASTISQIRELVDHNGGLSVIHVLGCGDPVSMTVLCYSGADSFDSLDWVRSVIDPIQFRCHEFSQLSLLDCECAACSVSTNEYSMRVLLHNLLAYQTMTSSLRSLVREQNLPNFVRYLVGDKLYLKIKEITH